MRIEQLLDRLAKNERLRMLLEQTTNLKSDELIESLLKEFEQVVERYSSLSAFAGRARKLAAEKAAEISFAEVSLLSAPAQMRNDEIVPKARHARTTTHQSLTVEPIKIDLPSFDLKLVERVAADRRAEEEKRENLRRELEAVERTIHAEIDLEWDRKGGGIQERIASLRASQEFLRTHLAAIEAVNEQSAAIEHSATTIVQSPPPEAADGDTLYLHAICPSLNTDGNQDTISLTDMKGIDGKNPLCIVEHAGLRCLVSKIHEGDASVTSSGVLLLSRDTSLQLRATHEEISNCLRTEVLHIPFVFGSVMQGSVALKSNIEAEAEGLRVALAAEAETKIWSIRTFAHDAQVGKYVASQLPVMRGQERGREARRPSKRSDVKLLEKMLQHEQKAAETIHSRLAESASFSEVTSMISLGNGVSDDWKLILEATYEVTSENRSRLFSAVLQLQEEYREMGIMFEVQGVSDRISFAMGLSEAHAISA